MFWLSLAPGQASLWGATVLTSLAIANLHVVFPLRHPLQHCSLTSCAGATCRCRLIDELRSTVRCKADRVFMDAQQHNPPRDFGWRKRLNEI